MEVQLTPEQEQQLSHLAAAVELGDRALDEGDYLTHEQVGSRNISPAPS